MEAPDSGVERMDGRRVRIGIDVGGTFTDAVLEVGGRRLIAKALTTTGDPGRACMQCLDALLERAALAPGDVDAVIHGTTLANNAIIERKGATTALLTTDGFRDTLQMGTEGRPDQYDLDIVQPEPLVPRRRRITIEERLNSRGEVLVPLTPAKIDAVLPALDAAGTESLAIAFLHSYANPVHERLARDHLIRRRPGWSISLSSEVSPEFREFERFSTTCANAYIRPLMERHLSAFAGRLRRRGFACPLLLMLSSGGLTTVETATAFPVRLVESGPAGGADACPQGIAARARPRQGASPSTWAAPRRKSASIDEATAQTSCRAISRWRGNTGSCKGSGLPLRIPAIEMVEIGAGGGSIARTDALRRIVRRPRTARAPIPGPPATRGAAAVRRP